MISFQSLRCNGFHFSRSPIFTNKATMLLDDRIYQKISVRRKGRLSQWKCSINCTNFCNGYQAKKESVLLQLKYFDVPGLPHKNNSESIFEEKHKNYNLKPSYWLQFTKFRCTMLTLRNITPLIIVDVCTYDTLYKIHADNGFHLVLVFSQLVRQGRSIIFSTKDTEVANEIFQAKL